MFIVLKCSTASQYLGKGSTVSSVGRVLDILIARSLVRIQSSVVRACAV